MKYFTLAAILTFLPIITPAQPQQSFDQYLYKLGKNIGSSAKDYVNATQQGSAGLDQNFCKKVYNVILSSSNPDMRTSTKKPHFIEGCKEATSGY